MRPESEDPEPPRHEKPVILVVEDEAMVGEVVRAMLHMGGFDSILARSPLEALNILADPSRHLDLLLTDFRMPHLTGMDLIQRCHSLRPGLKTVLYSGDADESVVANGSPKPNRFLRKPFTPNVLNDLVASLLAG